MKKALFVSLLTSLLLAACTPARFGYVKQGISGYDTENAESECRYQIRLNKLSNEERSAAVRDCMQSKGFRWKQIS